MPSGRPLNIVPSAAGVDTVGKWIVIGGVAGSGCGAVATGVDGRLNVEVRLKGEARSMGDGERCEMRGAETEGWIG